MADSLATTNYYEQLGGINQKASKYDMTTAQFLDIRNMDFDVPKALQKRPGSTFAIGSSLGTSGPILTLFEFQKLTGESYVVSASDTALFYSASGGLTLLSPGWNNGQPPDMLTFVNKMWVANGQSYAAWDGVSVFAAAGLPTQKTLAQEGFQNGSGTNCSWILVGGATHIISNLGGGTTYTLRGLYVAYSYLRNDGYEGPANFLKDARNIVTFDSYPSAGVSGQEFFSYATFIAGFTVPAGLGISAIRIWLAADTVNDQSPFDPVLQSRYGNLGCRDGALSNLQMSITLIPNADLSRFQLFDTVSSASFFAASVYDRYTAMANATMWCWNMTTPKWATFAIVAAAPVNFSGMNGNFFATYTPKYIEQQNNIMFYGGFSSAPSVIWFSDIGTPETIQPDSTFEVRTNDGDRVTGLRAFSNYVVVTKEKSFHKLIGSNADNFQLVQLSTDYGCLSQRTMITVDQKLYWLDRKGILEFNGAGWDIISGQIENVFRRMNLSAAREKASAVHHIYRNQIWFGIPVDGSTVNNLTIVYDYLIGAWTFFDGYNATSYAFIKGPLDRPTVWRGDQSGMIHYTGESFYSDSGNGITCMPFTRFENDGGQNQTTIWRRFFLDVAASNGATLSPITGKVFSNYDQTTVQATFQMLQNQFQSRAEMGVVGKAVAIQLSHYSASLPLLINGYGLAKRGLRNV